MSLKHRVPGTYSELRGRTRTLYSYWMFPIIGNKYIFKLKCLVKCRKDFSKVYELHFPLLGKNYDHHCGSVICSTGFEIHKHKQERYKRSEMLIFVLWYMQIIWSFHEAQILAKRKRKLKPQIFIIQSDCTLRLITTSLCHFVIILWLWHHFVRTTSFCGYDIILW